MNGKRVPLVGKDAIQTHVAVENVNIVHYPNECEGCFELQFIGRRRRQSGQWGKQARMYRCYIADSEIDKLLKEITQKYGGNLVTRVVVVDRDELEEDSD